MQGSKSHQGHKNSYVDGMIWVHYDDDDDNNDKDNVDVDDIDVRNMIIGRLNEPMYLLKVPFIQ